MNRKKFEGLMNLLDAAAEQAEEIKASHKACNQAESKLYGHINGLLNPHTKDDLRELIDYYIGQLQEIMYLIGIEDGAKLQQNNEAATFEEDIIKSIAGRVETVKNSHVVYIKAENELNEYIRKEFVSAAGTVMPIVSELIKAYATQIQEIAYLIGVNDGVSLQSKLVLGTFAADTFKEMYAQCTA